VAVVAVPFSVFCADGQIKIGQTSSTTFPITISSSGSYVLTSNLNVSSTSANAITIDADNVTIDLNGHAIIGPGEEIGTGSGIYANNSTITNCTVRANHEDGIYAQYATIITNCTAYENTGDGIQGGQRTCIECNNLKNNGEYGLTLVSSNNYAIKNTASNNTSGQFNNGGSNNHMPISGDNANWNP